MPSIITLLLILIGQLLPVVGANTAGISTITNTLVVIVPTLIEEKATDHVPIVQSIIAALKNNPATMDAQRVMLNDLDARCEAAFEDVEAKPQASEPATSTAGESATSTGQVAPSAPITPS